MVKARSVFIRKTQGNIILAARISSSSAAPDESGGKNLLQMAQIILVFSEIYGT
jgi:hypothetical protein